MAEFFGNKAKGSQGNNLETKYKSSIGNLLIVVCFSVVNIVLLLTSSDTYFLFSAFVPYFIVDYGMCICGLYPEEYYYDMPGIEFVDKSFLVVTVVVAAVILLVYLLCWFLAKRKKVGALIFALILFVTDTLSMLWMTGFSMDSIIDILFHVWVVAYLIIGISTYYKMKNAPEDVIASEAEQADEDYGYTHNNGNSAVLRIADNEVKSRILLQAEVPGYNIVYRRVKKTNELVVNGMVYDEYEALVEFPHTLTALIDGHKIEVQYDTSSRMYIVFDGEQLIKKIRIF